MKISKLIASLTLALCGAAHAWDYGPLLPRTDQMKKQTMPQTALICAIYMRTAALAAIQRSDAGEEVAATPHTLIWAHLAWTEVAAEMVKGWTDDEKMQLFTSMTAAAQILPDDLVDEQSGWCFTHVKDLVNRIPYARKGPLSKQADATFTVLRKSLAERRGQ